MQLNRPSTRGGSQDCSDFCNFMFAAAMFILMAALPQARLAASDETSADVVVYGGTSAGVAAAVQVVRLGHSVILVEPSSHIGGLTSGGLGFTDSGDKRVIGGVAREFYQRIRRHYDQSSAWVHEKSSDYPRYRPREDAMWTFEPKVAETVFHQMLKEANVKVLMRERLNRGTGVRIAGGRVVSITMESGKIFSGKQFIDTTYEGDLMAAAGVKYTVGREANSAYGETLNGNQVKANVHNHRFLKNVDPWLTPGDPSSGLVAEVENAGPGEDGTGDHRVQAYCFRMCMSKALNNRVPFPKPDEYDEKRYELLFRNFEAGDLRVPISPDMMPNGKTDTNNNCAFSTDYLGGNYRYSEASYEERESIVRDHEDYQKGLMWTLANHPRVPEDVRQYMTQWGLPADEFVDNGNWPHQLYIREARRMVSDYVVTELDCRRTRVAEDSVGLGSYNMDSHNVRRYITADGFVQNEGDVQVSPGGAYLISYRSLIPARGQVSNLSVPVCLSSSHIAYGSIRMEPVFMILGQSTATAAVQAIRANTALQDLPYAALREQLVNDGQVLDLPPGLKRQELITKASLKGLVLDDSDAKLSGPWTSSTSSTKYVGTGYLHDGDMEKGQKSLRWELTAVATGEHELRLAYSSHSNRASNVPVTVSVNGSVSDLIINQKKQPSLDGLFCSLGTYNLRTDDRIVVTVSNKGTDGYVVVDALQLLPSK